MKIKFLRKLSEEDFLFWILIILSIVLGVTVRANLINYSQYPYNDGGLFYQMTVDLIQNSFKLPAYTKYNSAGIPFAYPPLSFYLAGSISVFGNLPLLKVFQWQPFIISTLTLFAFYYFVSKIFKRKILSGLALFIFAMLPRSYEWFLMGGGIPRSIAYLFAIIAIAQIKVLFLREKTWKDIGIVALFSGLTILTHPTTVLFVALSAVVFFIYHSDKLTNFYKGLFVILGIVIIVSPWIYSVVSKHGWQPFLSAGGTGHSTWFKLKFLMTQNFIFENKYFLTIIGLFMLIGTFSEWFKESLLFYVMVISVYILIPRGGIDLMSIYVAPLAAAGMVDVLRIWPFQKQAANSNVRDVSLINALRDNRRSKIAFGIVIIYMFLGSYTYKFVDQRWRLSLRESDIAAMEWVREETDQDDSVLVFPAKAENRFWWNDYQAEWFPALANRKSVTTVQGYEWLTEGFSSRLSDYIEIYACAEYGPSCVESWEKKVKTGFDYIYIDKDINHLVYSQFSDSENYLELYSNDKIAVFSKDY